MRLRVHLALAGEMIRREDEERAHAATGSAASVAAETSINSTELPSEADGPT